MSRLTITTLALAGSILLAGCGGSDGDDDAPLAVIDAQNTLAYGQQATTSLNGMAGAGEALNEVMGQLSMLTTGSADFVTAQKATLLATEEIVECSGGGTVTIETSGSAEQSTVRFSADQCVDDSGAMLHGVLRVTVGQWDEFASSEFPGIELVMETGGSGLASDTCEFNGGLVLRVHAAESSDPYGDNMFVFEYGTTDAGFIAFCEPDEEINIAGDTLVRNEVTYAYTEGGGMTSSSSVNVHGGFEAPDGSGFVTVVAEDLEYAVTAEGDSTYGAASCPSSGQLTLTGGAGSTASIYFGDDAPPGYAVQVIGPDGYVAEFETCEAFLAATQ